MNSKRTLMSNELFAGKDIPDFIKEHSIFTSPIKVDKVFPSIGINNFKDKVNIDKPVLDLKKEGHYVINLLQLISTLLVKVRDSLSEKSEYFQFSLSREDRIASKNKISDISNLFLIVSEVINQVDPNIPETLSKTVILDGGKVALKLHTDVKGTGEKIVFKKGRSLFKIFLEIKTKVSDFGIEVPEIDKTQEFKTFSKENLTSKEYCVVFSSAGNDGAWDIATMSMRGIKSCQRWDGEYPRCLIGSIASKFVGIMYLTSGVDFENRGTKMLKRCIVRYVIDGDDKKPCIIIDKMYPEFDKDVAKMFVDALKSRTNIPVYYTANLDNKLRHLYIPSEKISEKLNKGEYSYQDTPIKSRRDYEVHIITNKSDEIEREKNSFRFNMGVFLSRRFDEINSYSRVNGKIVNPDVSKMVSNIKLTSTSLAEFCDFVANLAAKHFKAPSAKGISDSKTYMRKYLISFMSDRTRLRNAMKKEIMERFKASTSKSFDFDIFYSFIFSLFTEYVIQEMRSLSF